MWNRNKEDPPVPRPSSPAPSASELTREGIPMSTIPTKIVEPGGGAAAIGKSVVVKGQIYSREDLFVDGEVEGTIEVQEHRLTVGPNGRVKANVKARNVIIHGTMHGNVEASEKIDIRKEAKIVGDLRTSRVVIEDGAYFKGGVDIVRQEAPRAPAPDPPKPAAAPPPESKPDVQPNLAQKPGVASSPRPPAR